MTTRAFVRLRPRRRAGGGICAGNQRPVVTECLCRLLFRLMTTRAFVRLRPRRRAGGGCALQRPVVFFELCRNDVFEPHGIAVGQVTGEFFPVPVKPAEEMIVPRDLCRERNRAVVGIFARLCPGERAAVGGNHRQRIVLRLPLRVQCGVRSVPPLVETAPAGGRQRRIFISDSPAEEGIPRPFRYRGAPACVVRHRGGRLREGIPAVDVIRHGIAIGGCGRVQRDVPPRDQGGRCRRAVVLPV